MAATKYNYTISTSTADGKVCIGCLEDEILKSSIILTSLDPRKMLAGNDNLDIWFKAALDSGEQTELTTIVSNHSGDHDHKSAPLKSSDNRQVVLPTIFAPAMTEYLTGSGDSGSVRGGGTLFTHTSEVEGSTDFEFDFLDFISIAGGLVTCVGAEPGDYISFEILAPATVVVPNGSNEGNCDLVDLGGYNLIVPAAGDGTHDVDLSVATPVPAPDLDGYWDFADSETGKGSLTVSTSPGNAGFHLFDVAIPELARFVNKWPLLGDNMIPLIIPAIDSKDICSRWKYKCTIYNCGHTGLKVVWGLVSGRHKTSGSA